MKTWLTRILKGIGYAILGLATFGFMVGFYQAATNTTASGSPTTVAKPLTQDPVLMADAQQLAIDYSPLNLILTSESLNAIASGKTTETTDGSPIGLFLTPNTIYIQSGLDKNEELNIFAYEYMHYYWSNLSGNDQQSIATELDAYRNQNVNYNADVSRYHGDTKTIQDEEDSTACTRVDPSLLSDSFNAYCNQAIPNRSILF